jgi:hypothetical protein
MEAQLRLIDETKLTDFAATCPCAVELQASSTGQQSMAVPWGSGGLFQLISFEGLMLNETI